MTTPLISTIVPTFFCSAIGLLEGLGVRYDHGATAPEKRGNPSRAFPCAGRPCQHRLTFERRRQPGGVVELSAVRSDRRGLRAHAVSVVDEPYAAVTFCARGVEASS